MSLAHRSMPGSGRVSLDGMVLMLSSNTVRLWTVESHISLEISTDRVKDCSEKEAAREAFIEDSSQG